MRVRRLLLIEASVTISGRSRSLSNTDRPIIGCGPVQPGSSTMEAPLCTISARLAPAEAAST